MLVDMLKIVLGIITILVYKPMTVLKGQPILKSLEARDSARNKKNVSSETLGQTFWLSLGQ